MILRAAIVVLLVLNLGVAAWWIAAGDDASRREDAQGAGATPGLRLVSESVPPARAKPVPAALPAPGVPDKPDVTTPPAGIVQCLRFGPFAGEVPRDAARANLSAAGVGAEPRETAARSGRGWKVHIPAFATRDEAKAMGETIKAAGISDWYVMNEGDQANSIALGRYGSEDAARRREADLRAKGFAAQAAPLGNRAPQWWLDARIAGGVTPAVLAAIAPSSEVACTGLR